MHICNTNTDVTLRNNRSNQFSINIWPTWLWKYRFMNASNFQKSFNLFILSWLHLTKDSCILSDECEHIYGQWYKKKKIVSLLSFATEFHFILFGFLCRNMPGVCVGIYERIEIALFAHFFYVPFVIQRTVQIDTNSWLREK